MLAKARNDSLSDRRVRVVEHDLNTDVRALGQFDVVVSGFAIHHVDNDRKRTLFDEVATMLRPGGVFANLEVIKSATPELHADVPCGDRPRRRRPDRPTRRRGIATRLDALRPGSFRSTVCGGGAVSRCSSVRASRSALLGFDQEARRVRDERPVALDLFVQRLQADRETAQR